MKRFGEMVADKMDQWANEALMFCALHGKAGGSFEVSRWASGAVMAAPPGARVNQAIPVADLETLRANGWRLAFCPACRRLYNPARIPPPRVPVGISCACCCPPDEC